jgi:5-methylcytosine-specific restriction enzyme A
MPIRPPHPCRTPGCPGLTHEKYCSACAAADNPDRRRDRERSQRRRAETGSLIGLYAKDVWKNPRHGLRIQQLHREPLCADPYGEHGTRSVPATIVDHKVDHQNDWALFVDQDNLQSLCTHCHSLKTVRESGGFGNAKKV